MIEVVKIFLVILVYGIFMMWFGARIYKDTKGIRNDKRRTTNRNRIAKKIK